MESFNSECEIGYLIASLSLFFNIEFGLMVRVKLYFFTSMEI